KYQENGRCVVGSNQDGHFVVGNKQVGNVGNGSKFDANGSKFDTNGSKIDANGSKFDANGSKFEVSKFYSRLNWHFRPELDSEIKMAYNEAQKLIANIDLRICIHDDYGKDFMKKCQMSPD